MADHTARFSNWFQIISNVAIIVGLGLVIYELNQAKQLARAQFVIDNSGHLTNVRIATMGEDPRAALAKAALHPADLNESDAVALDAFYDSITLGWASLRMSSQIADLDAPWQAVVADLARRHFGSEPGRRWLQVWAAEFDDTFGMKELAQIAVKAVQEDSGDNYRSRYEVLLAND
jgi:hypothetical protein